MANQINKEIWKKIKVKNPKTGKTQTVSKKIGEKSTNVAKGMNTTLTGNKAKLKAQEIAEKYATKRNIVATKVGGRTADIANIATQAGSVLRAGIGSNANSKSIAQNNNVIRKDPGVDQNITGGITQGGNRRDDDQNDLIE